jgi:hypothetical protein
VTVKGPLTTARRTADVASLIGWVAMRAVDREAKRLDDAGKEQRNLEAAAEALRRVPDAAAAAAPQAGSSQPAPSAQARAPDPPASTDVKPVAPPARRPPPPVAAPKPFNLLDFLPAGGR